VGASVAAAIYAAKPCPVFRGIRDVEQEWRTRAGLIDRTFVCWSCELRIRWITTYLQGAKGRSTYGVGNSERASDPPLALRAYDNLYAYILGLNIIQLGIHVDLVVMVAYVCCNKRRSSSWICYTTLPVPRHMCLNQLATKNGEKHAVVTY